MAQQPCVEPFNWTKMLAIQLIFFFSSKVVAILKEKLKKLLKFFWSEIFVRGKIGIKSRTSGFSDNKHMFARVVSVACKKIWKSVSVRAWMCAACMGVRVCAWERNKYLRARERDVRWWEWERFRQVSL